MSEFFGLDRVIRREGENILIATDQVVGVHCGCQVDVGFIVRIARKVVNVRNISKKDASEGNAGEECFNGFVSHRGVLLSNFRIRQRSAHFSENGLADVKRYPILLHESKRLGGRALDTGKGLEKDVAIENDIRAGTVHARQSFAVLTRRLLRTLKEAVELFVAHLVETASNGVENFVKRAAVCINERLQILLWCLSERTGILLRSAEVLLVKCNGVIQHTLLF